MTNAIDGLVSFRSLQEATEKGLTLSAWLETQNPTSELPVHERNGDAYTRQLARLGIRVKNDPITGLRAHDFGRFWENTDEDGKVDNQKEARQAMVAEYFRRTYAEANLAIKSGDIEGKRLFDNQTPLNYTTLQPFVIPGMRVKELTPVMLPYLIARERSITGNIFKALYIDDTGAKAEAQMSRITEWAKLPSVQFRTSETAGNVYKYGRLLKVSYEQMRRFSIDFVGWAINYIAQVAAIDKENDAVDVLVNGDGNSGTSATSSNGSTYDSAAANKLTLKMLINFRLTKFPRPYAATTVIGRAADLTELLTLNAGSSNLAAQTYVNANTGINPLNVRMPRLSADSLIAVDNTGVAANNLLFIDRSESLEMVREEGADIVERDRIINGQWEEIALTESLGWAIATKDLNQNLAYTA